MGDVGHDVSQGPCWLSSQPPGTLALPAFSRPWGGKKGCGGSRVLWGWGGEALPAEWGPVLPPGSVCPSGSWEPVSLHGAGAGRWGAWLVSPALSSMLESRPPRLAPRSGQGSARGPFQDKTWRPHPAPVLGTCPMATHKAPYTACPSVFPAEGVWRTPHGLPPWTGSPSAVSFPVTWHHPLWGPCVLTVCVGGPRGDSWGVKQPGPGCPCSGRLLGKMLP